jgi:hypothetical protein
MKRHGELMSYESIQTAFVVVAAVALLLQASVLIGIALLIFKIRKPVQEVIANASEIARIARRRADDVDRTLGQLAGIAEQADAIARELLDRGHLKVLAADRIACDVLQRIGHATDETERIIKKPFRRFRALNAAFRAGLGYLFLGDRPQTNRRDA